MSATRLDQHQPLYKREHWYMLVELDQWTSKCDRVMACLPLGILRQGAPVRIFQTENDPRWLTIVGRASCVVGRPSI